MVERVDDTTGSVVLLIPQTGQRFTLTSPGSTVYQQASTSTSQVRSEERLSSRHSSVNSNLLTRMRRRDSYARAAAATAAVAAPASAVSVGDSGLIEGQQQTGGAAATAGEASQPSTSQQQQPQQQQSQQQSDNHGWWNIIYVLKC